MEGEGIGGYAIGCRWPEEHGGIEGHAERWRNKERASATMVING